MNLPVVSLGSVLWLCGCGFSSFSSKKFQMKLIYELGSKGMEKFLNLPVVSLEE